MPVEQMLELIQELESLPGEESRERTLRALRTVVEFYRGAFERVIEILEQNGGRELMNRLLEDPLLASILQGYGLVEDELERKVNTALDAVRPFLQSHGGGVTLVGISDKIAHLQLWGSCHGCSASLITLKTVIEKALHEEVPELEQIEVAGLTSTPADDARKWLPLLHGFELQNLRAGEFLKVQLFGEDVLVCRVDQHVFAFKNRCPAGQNRLDTAMSSGLFITCRCHGHRFDLRNGRHSDDAGLRLEVLPVKLSDDLIKVGL
jgi:Fe-S cluster biogenesis protein NfuA/nitrite reductase/ring-hydroxylating ferredoxin subunit